MGAKTLGVTSALMIISGYYGELTVTGNLAPRWICWAISMCFFLNIVQELLVGLPKSGTEAALGQHFSQWGTVTSVEFKYDAETGNCRGFGFVSFQDQATAELVLATNGGYSMFQTKQIGCTAVGA